MAAKRCAVGGPTFLLLGAVALAEPPAATPGASDFTPPAPTCIEWTNGCRLCRLADDGTPACSNVGIACQPKDSRCTLHREESKDEKKKDENKEEQK